MKILNIHEKKLTKEDLRKIKEKTFKTLLIIHILQSLTTHTKNLRNNDERTPFKIFLIREIRVLFTFSLSLLVQQRQKLS
jgi:hypothetical protein